MSEPTISHDRAQHIPTAKVRVEWGLKRLEIFDKDGSGVNQILPNVELEENTLEIFINKSLAVIRSGKFDVSNNGSFVQETCNGEKIGLSAGQKSKFDVFPLGDKEANTLSLKKVEYPYLVAGSVNHNGREFFSLNFVGLPKEGHPKETDRPRAVLIFTLLFDISLASDVTKTLVDGYFLTSDFIGLYRSQFGVEAKCADYEDGKVDKLRIYEYKKK